MPKSALTPGKNESRRLIIKIPSPIRILRTSSILGIILLIASSIGFRDGVTPKYNVAICPSSLGSRSTDLGIENRYHEIKPRPTRSSDKVISSKNFMQASYLQNKQ
jgi:hypothetical protein